MPLSRTSAASWALGLGVLSAAVAGSVVSAESAAQEMRHIGAFALAFVPALYVVIVRRWDHWTEKHPFVRFVVFFLGGFSAIVVLAGVAGFVFDGFGTATAALETLGATAGFGVAAWLALYGGGERVWTAVLARSDVEW